MTLGEVIYSRSSGRNSVLSDAPPIDSEGAFWIASCSKIVGTIAALQCVERGMITLDEPVSKSLPKLSNMEIITTAGHAESAHIEFHFTKATNPITLRHLLTHTSGLGYDIMDPTIMAWRSSIGEQPKTLAGTIVDAQLVPLKFEPGEGWLWTDIAPDDCAGAGLYSTVDDFIKVIGDLVKDSPILLNRETVEQMFNEQFPQGSKALQGLGETPEILFAMTGMRDLTKGVNFALGGIYIEEDTTMKKGTVCWGGLPNLYWFANRSEGVAGFYASQMLPLGDPPSGKLARAFFQEVFRLNSA
ncbi:Beta-lactamase family protein [Penicillium cf. viridicatum]|uniref:Beta-lactamase family protein n=1 Tax=Penicillium cf. viridicatum TaxID=2972119 RepID=A0A9W9N6X7_9EURO|nr:Beta-lactamase family protein [Penicillium cf. viridicatum]